MKIDAVENIRKRWLTRLDVEGGWKTIKGTHVYVGEGGEIEKGPENLRKLPKPKSEPITESKGEPQEAPKAEPKETTKEELKRERDTSRYTQEWKDAINSDLIGGSKTMKVKDAVKHALSEMPEGYTAISNGNAYKKVGEDEFEVEMPGGEKKVVNGKRISSTLNGHSKEGDFDIKGEGYEHKRSKSGVDINEKLQPYRDDYDYEQGDSYDDFVHKNVGKLMPIYEDGGSEAVDAEFYKFRLANTTKDIHEISREEADEIVYDNVRQSVYDGWFRGADSSYKPILVGNMLSSQEMRNAGLSLAYENYKYNTDDPLPFEEFLYTPIKMYRGGYGQKHTEDDVFSAYSFSKDMAEGFATGPNAKVTEALIRPIDTYGSMRCVGEAEIWVPREIAPNGNKDSADRLDAEEPEEWITVNGNHIPLDKDNEPMGGQLKVFGDAEIKAEKKPDDEETKEKPKKKIAIEEGRELMEKLYDNDSGITGDSLIEHPLVKKAKAENDERMGEYISANRRKNETINIHSKERGKMRSKIAQIINNRGSVSGEDEKGWTIFKGPIEKGYRAEIVIGPPASGKSSVIVDKVSRGTKAHVIDCDEVKKKFPEYDNGKGASVVHQESQYVLDNRILPEYYKGGSRNGENLVLPIVGRSVEGVLYHAQQLKNAGYDVHLSFCDVTTDNAIKRAVTRYIETGRFISPKYIKYAIGDRPAKVYEEMKKHKGLFSSFSHFNNDVTKGKKVEHLNGNGEETDWEEWR